MRQYLRVANVYEDRIDLADVLSMNFSPEEFEQYELRPGDILLNEGQSLEWVGRPAMYRGELPGCCFQNTLVRFRPHECVDGRFALLVFRHYLHNRRFQKIARWTVNIAHLGATRFAGIEFPVPPLNEQRRIVATAEELLTDLDVAVATLKRVRAKLKRYRAAVLKAAIDGKLTADWRARHPATEPATALHDRILAERRRRWEDAQRAKFTAADKEPPKGWQAKYQEPATPIAATSSPLPEGWQRASLGQLLHRIEGGKSFKCLTREANQDEWGVIKVSAMTWGTFLEAENKAIPADATFDPADEVRPGDLLLSRCNTTELVGASVLVGNCRSKLLLSDKSLRLLPSEAVNRNWLHTALSSTVVRKQLSGMATGTSDSMRNVSQEKIESVILPLPPFAEQAVIVQEIERRLTVVDQAAAQVEANLKRAARLRQGILKRAFEGKLVPQVATDEPASVLLNRIRQQRVQPTTQPAGTKSRKPTRRTPIRAVLEVVGRQTAYIVARAVTPFGRTIMAKLHYLAQTHMGLPLGLKFKREKYGPFDEDIHKAERVGRKRGWFDFKDQAKEKERTTYTKTPGTPAAAAEAATLLGDRRVAFDQLIGHFATLDSAGAELFATVYAAWNDLLLEGRPADEAAITAEVYGWHPSKREKFTPEAITCQIAWMRTNGYAPTGTGERTTVPDRKSTPARRRKSS
jgi:type I restriction enzyme S subunit